MIDVQPGSRRRATAPVTTQREHASGDEDQQGDGHGRARTRAVSSRNGVKVRTIGDARDASWSGIHAIQPPSEVSKGSVVKVAALATIVCGIGDP